MILFDIIMQLPSASVAISCIHSTSATIHTRVWKSSSPAGQLGCIGHCYFLLPASGRAAAGPPIARFILWVEMRRGNLGHVALSFLPSLQVRSLPWVGGGVGLCVGC